MLLMAQIKGVGPIDAPNLINIAKALGGEQGGFGTTSLKHGVDGNRRAVQKQMGVVEFDLCFS